jgi:hypothetical protein
MCFIASLASIGLCGEEYPKTTLDIVDLCIERAQNRLLFEIDRKEGLQEALDFWWATEDLTKEVPEQDLPYICPPTASSFDLISAP